MCISGKIGAKIKIPHDKINSHEYLFGEDQSRYIIEVSEKSKDEVANILEKNSVYYEIIGKTQKESLILDNEINMKLSDLKDLHSSWFRNYFN
jgi:phosphoribosylformylglycinamidine synthase